MPFELGLKNELIVSCPRHGHTTRLLLVVCIIIGCGPKHGDQKKIPIAPAQSGDFLSQTNNDFAFLEEMQRVAYYNKAAFPSFGEDWQKILSEDFLNRIADVGKKTKEQREQARNELREQIRKLPERRLPTRLENPATYFLVSAVNNHIFDATKAIGYQLPTIIIGTLPTRSANARSVPSPSGGRIIVLNTGLFNAVNRFVKALAPVIKIMNSGNMIELGVSLQLSRHLARPQSDVFIRFLDVGLEYLQLSSGEDYMLPGEYLQFHYQMVTAVESFVLAHEYAHAILSHNTEKGDSKALGSSLANDRWMEPEQALHAWIQELEADRLGTKIMLSSVSLNKSVAPEIMAAAPDIALQLIDYLDNARLMYESGEAMAVKPAMDSPEMSLYTVAQNCIQRKKSVNCLLPEQLQSVHRFSDHPPGSLRRDSIRAFCKEEGLFYEEKNRIDIGSAFAELIQLMWPNTVRVYAEVRRRKPPVK